MYLFSNLKLSENFRLGELTVKKGVDGWGVNFLIAEWFVNLVVLAQRLQTIRKMYGNPIIINSGFRTKDSNKEVGGSENSQHLTGSAADIRPASNGSINELWQVVNSYWGVGGIGDGRTKGFIHVDIRPTNARWTY
jgi:uncharacterized protein YcbK (DUF882 family)